MFNWDNDCIFLLRKCRLSESGTPRPGVWFGLVPGFGPWFRVLLFPIEQQQQQQTMAALDVEEESVLTAVFKDSFPGSQIILY